jgi:ParB family chromosome partitioning protein
MLSTLPIDSIVPAEDNLRRRVGDLRDLTASIAAVGVVEPLVVSPDGEGHYRIVAGHRRHAAAQKAGLTELPCAIRTLSDTERVEIMLVENLQRSDLSPIEEAAGYFRLVEHGLTQRELAARVGRSPRHVAARLTLLELPRRVQDELHAGRLTVGDGQALLALRDEPEVIERILGDEWSRQDIERAVVREQQRREAARTAQRNATTDGNESGSRRRTRPSNDDPEHSSDPAASERAEAKARNAASNARIDFARALVTRKLPKADATALVAAQVLADLSATHAKLTCRILDTEPVEGPWGPDYRATVEARAAASTADRDRALLAAALAIGEEAARHSPTGETATRHAAFLRTYGFDAEIPAT